MTEVENAAGEAFQRRLARLERLRVAADHDQQLPGLGRGLAARDRHVEQDDAGIGQATGEPFHGARRDCRRDTHDQSGARGAGDAVGTQQDCFRLLVEADDDDDEIAGLRHRSGIGSDRDP